MRKRAGSFFLCLVLAVSLLTNTATAATTKQYSSDWLYWSQGATAYGGRMQSSGCRVVAQAKLLMEAGIASEAFDPDVYADWTHVNGYFGSINQSIASYIGEQAPQGTAPSNYAKGLNKTLYYCGQITFSNFASREDKNFMIMNWLNKGYYVILGCNAHHVYVPRTLSINNGKPMISESQSTLTTGYVTPHSSYNATSGGTRIEFAYARLYSKTTRDLPDSLGNNNKNNDSTFAVVTTSSAQSITQSSAVLYGSAKSTNGKMTQCGMKIGTSESNMTKLGSDTINTYSTSMWYSTSKYGYTLQPGTTYYYRAYAVVDGVTYDGNTLSFTTPPAATPTASISLNKNSLSIQDNACAQLTATTIPSGQAVSWTSSNPSVATVNSSGGVTGLRAGTTTITASVTYGGNTYFASCKVTVTAANSVTYTVSGASSITQSTARVDASCHYTGTRPTTVGLYLGTSKSKLSNYGSDTLVSTATNNPVSVWYNLNNLSAGTTYYYQFYAVANGTTYTSDILSFTTTGEVRPAAPQKPTVWVGGSSVTVTWNAVANAQKYDVYLIQSPWRWEDVKYSGSTTSTSYAFTNVADGSYGAFVIARPNDDSVQSARVDFTVSNNTSGDVQIEVEGPITIVETPVYSGTVTGTGSSYLAINDKPAASPAYSNQIGSIPPGGTVKIYPDKQSGNWYYVSYNGVSGYAYSKYITLN